MALRPAAFDHASPALQAYAGLAAGRYLAIVDRIHDGDTYHAMIAAGFDSYVYVPIRMRGINAPELTSADPAVRAAAVAARDHLATLIPPGTPIVLVPKEDTQSFTRYVALTYDRPDHEVGHQMVADGYAVILAGEEPDGATTATALPVPD